MVYNKKNILDISFDKMILLIVAFIPIVDTLNGMLIKGSGISGIGILYRAIFFLIIIFYQLIEPVSKHFVFLIINFFIFIFVQYVVSGRYAVESIELTVKMFTPIFMITAFKRMLVKRAVNISDINKLFEWLSIAFPLTIIIPYGLHLGYSTYANNIGYKAFYYATNEISFAIVVMIIYLWSRLKISLNCKYILLYFMNSICCLLIGSKIAIGMLVVFTFLLVKENIMLKGNKIKTSRLLIVAGVIASIILAVVYYQQEIIKVINRWTYLQGKAINNINFFTSGRVGFLSEGFIKYKNIGLLHQLFGWGLGGGNNGMGLIEMDFFDLLFSCGVLGTINIILIYYILLRYNYKKSKESLFIILICFTLSFLGGHVLFTGLGGMMLGLVIFYSIILIKQETQFKTQEI